ncbi:SBBP repeat-containing protein [Microcoleus sp. FACHB-53]|nr:SBBP repeat-containing protein [Microcoleus sp. FACHB-53]
MPATESPIAVNASAQLPLSFIANAGQANSDVQFQVRGAGHTIFFTASEIILSATEQVEDQIVSSVVRSQLVGANPNPSIVGLNPLPGVANFLLGNDPSQWYTNVSTYGGVVYQNVYAGIDRVFKGTEGELKSEFIVAPGADPGQIRMNFSGVESIQLRDDGALVLQTPLGELIEEAPYIYQEINGQRQVVQGAYTLLGNNQVGFTLGTYNPAYTLVIDPVLEYSTYLGGNGNAAGGFDEVGNGIAVDATGVYLTGSTPSTNFPVTAGAVQPTLNPFSLANTTDVFVTKLNPAGNAVLYSTFIGGAGSDVAGDITLDSAGNIYLTGVTTSPSILAAAAFPTVNAVQATFGGGLADAFALKLNAAGNALIYSTYLGGTGNDGAFKLALDGAGNAYITGLTESLGVAAFSTANAFQANNNGNTDGFVTQLNPNGGLLYGTYLGGSQFDSGNDIQVDSAGLVYLTGDTDSAPNSPTPFTITAGALQPTFGGVRDAFVVKLNVGAATPAAQLVYSSYYGGNGLDSGDSIAVDSAGNIYIAGDTESTNLPAVNAAQPTFGGVRDTFVAKLNAAGSALVYSTYLGGSQSDSADYLAVDSAGNAYVTGETLSTTDYPTVNPVQTFGGGTQDAFAAMLNPNGVVFYNTYLGGNGYDEAFYIAVDNAGNAYVTGQTGSTNFSTPGAYQTTYGGGNRDVFLSKIRPNTAPVLNNTGSTILTTIAQNDTNNTGTLVSAILASGSPGNPITDPDPGALQGIAVMAVDNTNGTWQFSTDGGANWTPFGTPSENAARLLVSDANTRIRFVPNANFNGNVATGITFRAWDQTLGTNGSTANITTIGTGGATPFSTDTETAAIAVTAAIDTPTTTPTTPPNPSNNPNDFVTIGGSTGPNQLLFTLNENSAAFVNEVGVFVVDDDQGTVNGIAPGTAGYLQAALSQGKVILSTPPNLPNGFGVADQTRVLNFNSNERLGFYFVQNSTTDTVLADLTAGRTPSNVFFSFTSANSDGFDHLQLSDQGNGVFIQRWEDMSGGGDQDFNDLVMTIQPTIEPLKVGVTLQGESQHEVIDLRNQTAGLQAQFVVNREAAFDNFVGFYRVVDVNGGIDTDGNGTADVRPGEGGYAQAAIQQRVQNLDLTVANQSTATFTAQLEGGLIYAPFLIANGRPDALVDGNSSNDPAVYFPFFGANADGVDHIRLLGDNTFGFEDLSGGGDRDYNDVIVQVNFA